MHVLVWTASIQAVLIASQYYVAERHGSRGTHPRKTLSKKHGDKASMNFNGTPLDGDRTAGQPRYGNKKQSE
jgi:hypothetical protein